MSEKIDSLWIAGASGLVGSALARFYRKKKIRLLTPSRSELDLTSQVDVEKWMEVNNPSHIIMAAGTVGGIGANHNRPAEFISDNIIMARNVIHSAFKQRIEKLVYLGSSCIYPKEAEQPIKETSLLTGTLEPTNEPYAIAKIAGLKMCESYRSQYKSNFVAAMPCNIYGVGDTYHAQNSHVIPAMILKLHDAKIKNLAEIEVWGTGDVLREFMWSGDLARALDVIMRDYNDLEHINIGSGEEISIKKLVKLIAKVVGYQGDIVFNPDHPDGVKRKIVDNTKITALGWRPQMHLKEGLEKSYNDFLERRIYETAFEQNKTGDTVWR
ncbi:MAG: GDP-fucose synthetase [Alphaproteobacteria bacterium]|nr:GDP-fucose synthetase [Alphaproteobacteria bacterium]|tara:strand:+ start:2922 stop:3899 length:978 start_codon:yes stop_codon:yes gene_type:complete